MEHFQSLGDVTRALRAGKIIYSLVFFLDPVISPLTVEGCFPVCRASISNI